MYKKIGKPEKMPIGAMIGAVILDPLKPGFQPRNVMPLNPDILAAYKKSGEWDPTKPATYVVLDGQTVILDGNTRTRYANEAGISEGWFIKAELPEGANLMDIQKNRARSNIFSKSDPWTQAETFFQDFQQDMSHEEIASSHGTSVATVRKYLRMYDIVKSLGPKPKPEETAEQTESRLKKAAEAQAEIISGLRSGAVSSLDVERVLSMDKDPEAFDKAIKSVTKPKKEKVAEAAQQARAETLDEYKRLGVPQRFLPDLKAQVTSRSTGLTQEQITVARAVIDVIIGILPKENFLKGDFTPPPSEEDDGDLEEVSDEVTE